MGEVLVGARIMLGQRVRLVGLLSDQSFNGKLGRTVKFRSDKQRFLVALDDGCTKSCAPKNLEPAAPQPVPERISTDGFDFSNGRAPLRDDKNDSFFPCAVDWDPRTDHDLRGYVAMEKYDGIRAMWEGPRGGFRTRGGDQANKNLIVPSASFARLLPSDLRLDGELWSQRGAFEEASRFRSGGGDPEERWAPMIYKVFDAPSVPGPFVSRLAAAEATLCALAQAALAGGEPRRVHVAQTAACEDLATAIALRTRVESFGGEGLVLRRAGSFFRPGKAADSRDVLKFKTWHDSEARVVAWVPGKESLWVETVENGTLFKVSAGQRTWLARGAVITYKYNGVGAVDGGPRFPSILKVHDAGCECDACGKAASERWPVSATWRLAPSGASLERVGERSGERLVCMLGLRAASLAE